MSVDIRRALELFVAHYTRTDKVALAVTFQRWKAADEYMRIQAAHYLEVGRAHLQTSLRPRAGAAGLPRVLPLAWRGASVRTQPPCCALAPPQEMATRVTLLVFTLKKFVRSQVAVFWTRWKQLDSVNLQLKELEDLKARAALAA